MSSVGVATHMAHVHGPLARTNTAPVFSSRSAGGSISSTNGLPGLAQTMSHNSRSSQLSGSTAFTSSSTTSLSSMTSSATLVPPQSTPQPNGGNVVATNNIINQRADASRSLYQICVMLRQRLAQVPGFDAHLTDSDDEDEGEEMDPVSSLWRCLRKGTPLLTIYNCLQPPVLLEIDEKVYQTEKGAEKVPKMAAFKFVKACLEGDLQLPPGECFSLQDLFGDDTTGFVKVTQVINVVLDAAEQRGLLMTSEKGDSLPTAMTGGKMTYRDHVVRELVDTERKYVQDLENLHELKKAIEQKGVIPGDVVHDIFLNINAILDFQRRFLIKIETTNSQPESMQQWGQPFTNYEEAFGIYQPFIANQRKAAAIAMREFEKIRLADHPVVVDFNTLDGFLLKPMQRLVKYPLLLKVLKSSIHSNLASSNDTKDLRDKTDADEQTKDDLTLGIEAANRVLTQANSAVDRELRNEALEDLCMRVDDWKNHRVDHFGELLLHGHFPVVTGKSDVQKEVRSNSFPIKTPTIRHKLRSRTKSLVGTFNSNFKLFPDDTYESQWDAVSETPSERNSLDQRHGSSETDLDHPLALADMIFHEFNGLHPITGNPFSAEKFANESGIVCPSYQQYTIYLFERILLCCKEVNPNKSKDKLMGAQKEKKDKKDKNKSKEPNKNAKLQLKGRIFMTNVTEVLSLAKQGNAGNFNNILTSALYSPPTGSYTVQIFWKGDPGVENFIIRFSNEETMKKWYSGVDGQRKEHATSLAMGSSPEGGVADFAWMRDQTAPIPNPYAEKDDDDDDDDLPQQNYQPQPLQPNSTYPGPGMTRNPSSTSLRSRSTTGESTQSLAGIARAPPPRFPMGLQNPSLSLQTNIASQMPSPGQRGGDSYFSPVAESPVSSRTSTTSSMFPFPRQGTPQNGWEEHNRYTAPAMPRAPSRGSQTAADAYQMNGRNPQRPSLPAMGLQQSQASVSQQRSRSYSTPDINAQNGSRRLPNGTMTSQVPAVPGIPPHLHPAYDGGIPRSANNSPNGLPMRSNTQSPGTQRERLAQSTQYPNGPQYSRNNTTQMPITTVDNRTMSPPLGSAMSGDSDMALPTQLKVKVNCENNYITLVVAFNITYQSLIDRIDAKVGRFSNSAIAKGTMRLRYRDEDMDYVTIESDDDIQIAFQEWRESQKLQYHTGQLGEIELFCLSVDN